jgi:DNA-binding transcriptional LysR family regulator
MTEAQLDREQGRPKGPLKVTATVALGSTWLTPRMGEFLEVYPDIEVDCCSTTASSIVSMREADVAIRMAPPRQPELIQRHLLTVHMHIYAAPDYIKKLRRSPSGPRSSTTTGSSSMARRAARRCPTSTGCCERAAPEGKPRRAVLTVNNVYCDPARRAERAGPRRPARVHDQGATQLVRVLPELEGPRVDAYFVYPEELRSSKRIQVFRDFLLRKVAEFDF